MSVIDNNLGAFLNETTEIEQRITDAKANIARIQEFQGQILNSTSSSAVNSATKERENFISSTRNLLIECKDRVKKIQYENARVPPSDPNFGIRQQRYEYLRTKLSNVLEDYRQAESEFMKQTKDRMARQYIVVNPNATQQEIDDYTSNPDSDPIFQHALLKSTEAKNALAEVQKRHGDIKNIENTIAELAALFQELHLQVEAQDQTIINIEHNAETVTEKTEQAVGQLGKANLLAKAARKKKWICFGIFILIVIIIVVVIITQLPQIRGDNSQSNNTNKTVTPALINSPSSPSLT